MNCKNGAREMKPIIMVPCQGCKELTVNGVCRNKTCGANPDARPKFTLKLP